MTLTLTDLALYCLMGPLSCQVTPMPTVDTDKAFVYICADDYDAEGTVRLERNGMKLTAVFSCPTREEVPHGA